jgi:hypothetical protein
MTLLDENYKTIATEVGATILPVAHGFDLLRTKDKFARQDPYIFPDNKHPNLIGSYLSACIIVRMLYPKPARFLRSYPSAFTRREAVLLQKRAKQTLKISRKLGL